MPEGLEAEIWRRASEPLIGRSIDEVWVDPRAADPELTSVLPGSKVIAVRRRGKVVLIDTDAHIVGLHFGMTGRLIIDGAAPIEQLEYASGRDRPEWDRIRLWTGSRASRQPTDRVPAVRLNDPRRLGRISLDPDLDHLGVDIFDVTNRRLAAAFSNRRLAVKSALLDQSIIAGLGNLCADEVLWWAGVAPSRPVDELSADDIGGIAAAIRRRLPIMMRRGGSTTGTLTPEVRARLAPCPRDGAELTRTTLGGRTAVWCVEHQR